MLVIILRREAVPVLAIILTTMAERRPWCEEEDRCLRFVFEKSRLAKRSQVAR